MPTTFILTTPEIAVTQEPPSPQSPSPPTPIPRNLTLIAAAPNQNIDRMYQRLEEFLQQQDFRKANEQTWELMKQMLNGGYFSYLNYPSIENFSCFALERINNLWVKYSDGKFGFSVQKDIWKSIGGNRNAYFETYKRFAIKVGWTTGKDEKALLIHYNDLTFSLDTKDGHLPFPDESLYDGYVTKPIEARWPERVGSIGPMFVLFSRCEL